MRAQESGWRALWPVAAGIVFGILVAGCAGTPERVPRCRGDATPINVPRHAAGSAGSDERGQ